MIYIYTDLYVPTGARELKYSLSPNCTYFIACIFVVFSCSFSFVTTLSLFYFVGLVFFWLLLLLPLSFMWKNQTLNWSWSCSYDSHGLPFVHASWSKTSQLYMISFPFIIIIFLSYSIWGLTINITLIYFAAVLLKCHSHCVLLWNCYVSLHMA